MPSRVKSLHDVRVHEENEAAVCHDDEKSVKGDAGKRHLEIDLAALLDEMHAAPGNLELNYRNVTAIIPVLQALKDCRLQPDAPSGSAGTFASTRRAAKSTYALSWFKVCTTTCCPCASASNASRVVRLPDPAKKATAGAGQPQQAPSLVHVYRDACERRAPGLAFPVAQRTKSEANSAGAAAPRSDDAGCAGSGSCEERDRQEVRSREEDPCPLRVYTPTGRPLLELEEWNDEILQTVSDMETLVADLLAVEKAKYVESKRQVLEHFFPKTGHCRAAILDGDVRTEDWATCDSTIACVCVDVIDDVEVLDACNYNFGDAPLSPSPYDSFSRPADVSTTAPVPFAEVGFGGGPAKHHAKNEPKFVQLKLWLADSDAPKFEAAAGESIPSEGEEGHSDSSGDDDFLNFAVSMYEYETCGRPGARTSAKSYLVTNWYLMSPGFFAAFKGDQLQIGFGPITAKLRIADDHKRGELERFLTLAQELTAQRATFARALQVLSLETQEEVTAALAEGNEKCDTERGNRGARAALREVEDRYRDNFGFWREGVRIKLLPWHVPEGREKDMGKLCLAGEVTDEDGDRNFTLCVV
mmetsp:Transcript_8525/g.20606  ORF Transcript_8525/g.20606 Transcript_8525/m.20606 type:complete len:586 (-) Transcript_8525:136-1893(-)|eukprot:CAMPEP_0178983768 /NCGR_PEP_ID=MMETSP0795-20121207/1243_1 /TAXON_ID=88552 /ORGANISM="Amoebophrya sp., Strain Ameob2" /LENGTH=585 /DNA_ID=CAMNT_0020674577 /DNA_START=162 /DNA_END=1919 /DNA_ORIENTATION=+